MEKPVALEQLPNTFIVGFSDENNNDEEQRVEGLCSWLSQQMRDEKHTKLAVGGVIVEEMRAAIYEQTGFRCSAGIGHNKVLSKLVCGLHKPNRQTILPHSGVMDLYRNMPVKKVRHLGGKFGESVVELLGCKVMADLTKFSEAELQAKFDFKNGTWLYNIVRGIDHDPVTPRLLAKSIGCCKAFKGTQALTSLQAVENWALDLAKELEERLAKDQEENKRYAKLLTVSFILGDASSTRSLQFNAYNAERIAADAIDLIKRSNADQWSLPIKYLGLSAGKFIDESSNQNSIQNFFKTVDKPSCEVTQTHNDSVTRTKGDDKEYNHSFFMKYFKKQSKESVENISSQNVVASTSKAASSSMVQINDMQIDFMRETKSVFKEEKPGCSNADFSEQNSNSSNSVTFISLGEIFPDLNKVDDDVVELLPSPMQRELNSRKAQHITNKINNSKMCTNQLSAKADLFPKIIDELRVDAENSNSADFDPYCLNESTDVDDDLLPSESKNPIAVSTTSLFPNSRIPDISIPNPAPYDDDDSRSSLPNEEYNPMHLCPKCSNHIPLQDFTEHLDFHTAQELHKELNSAPVVKRINNDNSADSKRSPVKVYNGKKRGRPKKSTITNNSDKKLRSITSFFVPNK